MCCLVPITLVGAQPRGGRACIAQMHEWSGHDLCQLRAARGVLRILHLQTLYHSDIIVKLFVSACV